MLAAHRLAIVAVLLTPLAAATQDPQRLHTDRSTGRVLPLPAEEDTFVFAVFGDRTGGPAEGIAVLRQAVADTNLLDPDLVMTVGDLIQGYSTTEPWLEQMREYRAVMGELRMPWFPVAGNHDVYWRGPNKPPEEHEQRYEEHFGPLWYAFQHKDCWFVVLYSDEPDPDTGIRDFNRPASQRMSPEQLGWLQGVLRRASEAAHVFVFLHHPRWLGGKYGDDWEKVHRTLAAAGNVRAVFAGHIHRMRWDGRRDGIEYVTLATTGGHQRAQIPGAGYLHHYDLVTVRPDGIQLATIPVGAVIDPRQITGAVSEDVSALDDELRPEQSADLVMAAGGGVDGAVTVRIENPCQRPIDLTVTPQCRDRRWRFSPDHVHPVVAAGASVELTFRAHRPPAPLDENFALPELEIGCDYLGEGLRLTLPVRQFEIAVTPPPFTAAATQPADPALRLDGDGDCLRLRAAQIDLPDGPLTCEAWLRADALAGRRGLINKTENSEFGLFVSDGRAEFTIHLDDEYRGFRSPAPVLEPGRWHHVAGVYDGAEVRLYVDGELLGHTAASGERTRNDHPLLIGADPDRDGEPTSFFAGFIDEVRISTTARYTGDAFDPQRRHQPDGETALLLHLDRDHGPWTTDASPHGRHPRTLGDARCALVPGQ